MFNKPARASRPTLPPSVADVTGLLEQRYRQHVAERGLLYDAAQLSVLGDLQALLEQLTASCRQTCRQRNRLQSLYIFGDVGHGKSMLMSLFYEACPFPNKRRVHFSVFMSEVHAFIHDCRQPDNIAALAEKIKASVALLCFDEFQVTDIADAMLLGRLFNQLFERGVVAVITSNRSPDDLYQGGLLRDQFLFFIDALHSHARVIELAAGQDYRFSYAPARHSSYYFPLDQQAGIFAQRHFSALTQNAAMTPGCVNVLGRDIMLSAVQNDVALARFDELCVNALGPADYLAIARRFRTLILVGIPKLGAEQRNEAKRLLTLIDALYEHKVKLICTAEVPACAIYTEGDGAFEFKRALSRLIEMQSEHYRRSETPSCC